MSKQTMPDDIKTKFNARKACHPDKIVWAALTLDGNWLVFAHTALVAKRKKQEVLVFGAVVFDTCD